MSSLIIMLHWISRETSPGAGTVQRLERHQHLHYHLSQRCNSPSGACCPLPRRSFPPTRILLCFIVLLKIHQPHTLQSWTWCLLLSSLVFHIPLDPCLFPLLNSKLCRWGFGHGIEVEEKESVMRDVLELSQNNWLVRRKESGAEKKKRLTMSG